MNSTIVLSFSFQVRFFQTVYDRAGARGFFALPVLSICTGFVYLNGVTSYRDHYRASVALREQEERQVRHAQLEAARGDR